MSPKSALFNFHLGLSLLVFAGFPVRCFLTFGGGLVSLVMCKAKLFQEKLQEKPIYLVAHLLTLFILFPPDPSPNTAVSQFCS